jgi:uncharacterized protein YndB with AHSA1/START domain
MPAMAVGVFAVGALAFGAMAIGRLAVRNARIRSLEIGELKVRQLDLPEMSRIDRHGKGAAMASDAARAATARTGMLIRRPAGEIFEAIVDPAITSKFWFTGGSGRLEPGKTVQWNWDMYDVSIQVTPKVVEPDRRIVIEWPGHSGPTTVEWIFAPHPDGTFVSVTEAGFTGNPNDLPKYIADSTQGFTLMLAGLKALLEHNVRLNLTADRHPKGVGCPH